MLSSCLHTGVSVSKLVSCNLSIMLSISCARSSYSCILLYCFHVYIKCICIWCFHAVGQCHQFVMAHKITDILGNSFPELHTSYNLQIVQQYYNSTLSIPHNASTVFCWNVLLLYPHIILHVIFFTKYNTFYSVNIIMFCFITSHVLFLHIIVNSYYKIS